MNDTNRSEATMQLQVTPIRQLITPTERAYVSRQLQLAREDATDALTRMRAPRPAVAPPVREAIAACYEAAEHLHDVLQVDVPTEMVTDVRRALEELRTTIAVLDRRRQPGVHPPDMPVEPLGRAIAWLERLEQQVRAPAHV